MFLLPLPSDNGQPDLVNHSKEEILHAIDECIKNSDKHTLKRWLEVCKENPFLHGDIYPDEIPLHLLASKPEYKEYLELLLDYIDYLQIDINATIDNFKRETALHIACWNGCEENVLLLLQKQCDVDRGTRLGTSALHLVARTGNLKILQYLLDYGANIHRPDGFKSTPLHEAASYGHLDVARLLLEKGAKTRSLGYEDKLPLHSACWKGDYDMILLLVEQDSSTINGQSCNEVTPLMEASEHSRDERCVRFLHKNGASFSCKDSDGRLALHYAAKNNNDDVLQYVLEHTDASSIEQCFEDIPNLLKNEKEMDSIICCAIDSRNIECLKILLSSNKLSPRILRIPRICGNYPYHIVYSPLTSLFRDKKSFASEKFDLYLRLLLEHNLTMVDKFFDTFKTKLPIYYENHLPNPFSDIIKSKLPLSKQQYYLHWLNTNGITADYGLQCYYDNTQLFASFDDYGHYYRPVLEAILNKNAEALILMMSTSAILEPDKLIVQMNMLEICDDLPIAESTSQCHVSRRIIFNGKGIYSGEEHCNMYKYLISLKPIFHAHAQLLNLATENNVNVWFPCYTPNASREFAESTLKQLCRTTIRHHLRKDTLEANLRDFRRSILELPLPPSLKDYLLFKS